MFVSECVAQSGPGGGRYPPGVQGGQQGLDTVVSALPTQYMIALLDYNVTSPYLYLCEYTWWGIVFVSISQLS